MGWNKTHTAVVGGIVVAIGTMVQSLPTWSAALQPAFVGGAAIAIGTVIAAIYVERP